ncbi:hypothetical protein [Streptomyces sp. AK04-3B]|uniref:hypothetical protein n=1 Tax=Streptomyces sp. AK04-3B TaxID=3028650 RepID=UPI0029BC6EE0|nr:hypothetical protein [Streptomyces sp. AK04-3B]MDX3804625.1 hypothetical protein [Streptomyces sp. AK04-3B]
MAERGLDGNEYPAVAAKERRARGTGCRPPELERHVRNPRLCAGSRFGPFF